MPSLSQELLRPEPGALERIPFVVRRWLRTRTARGTLASLAMIVCVWIGVEWLSREQISVYARHAAAFVEQVAVDNTQIELRLGSVEGLERVSRADLERALDLPRRGSVLRLSTGTVRDAVEALPWIYRAEVRIGLPGVVHLKVEEETPVALWWAGRRWWFVNADGEGFAWAEQGAPSFGLPRVTGRGAPGAVAEVRAMLAQHAGLLDGRSMFERIGERRWNVRLSSGVLLMLPEEGLQASLQRLRDFFLVPDRSQRDVAAIDLRIPDRIALRLHLSEGESPARARPAGEDS